MRRHHPSEPKALYPRLNSQLQRSAKNPMAFLLVMYGVMLEGNAFLFNFLKRI